MSDALMPVESGDERELQGLLVEFETVDDLLRAAETVRDAGYEKWDAHTPFPVHGLDRAMGLKPTRLPLIVFGGGLTGTITGILLQWWTNAVDYPYIIGGKPLFSLPANIPVAFELTILLAAFGAFFGMLMFNGLPMLYHALFTSRRFARATSDRFFIFIEAADPRFDEDTTREMLESLAEGQVERIVD